MAIWCGKIARAFTWSCWHRPRTLKALYQMLRLSSKIRKLKWRPSTCTTALSKLTQPGAAVMMVQSPHRWQLLQATQRKAQGKVLMLRSKGLNEQSREGLCTSTSSQLEFWQRRCNAISVQHKAFSETLLQNGSGTFTASSRTLQVCLSNLKQAAAVSMALSAPTCVLTQETISSG